jgi:hypothetical protein
MSEIVMMTRYYLMTYHGTLLRHSDSEDLLSQVSIFSDFDLELLSYIDIPSEFVRPPYCQFITDEPPREAEVDVRYLGRRTIIRDSSLKVLFVRSEDGYLSARPQNRMDHCVAETKGWERFVPLTYEELIFIKFIRQNKWIVKSTHRIIDYEKIEIGAGPVLNIDDSCVPIAYNLPFDQSNAPFRFVILKDGWKIDEIILFRPLVYYCAFGDENVLGQLFASLRSLAELASYDEHVLVFTDRPRQEICERAPWISQDKLLVKNVDAHDWVGYVAGKYQILDVDEAGGFQPLAYMDPDIVFNAAATTWLIPMAVSERLTAPLESTRSLATAPSVGATLLQLDNEQPRFACGFNCGTIGIPNLAKHRPTLELVRRIIVNYSSLNGRGALSWVDQEVANYVSYKLANFDTNELSRCVRYGNTEDAKTSGALTGLVHFWRVPREARVKIMEGYIRLLLSQKRRTKPAARPTITKNRRQAPN